MPVGWLGSRTDDDDDEEDKKRAGRGDATRHDGSARELIAPMRNVCDAQRRQGETAILLMLTLLLLLVWLWVATTMAYCVGSDWSSSINANSIGL